LILHKTPSIFKKFYPNYVWDKYTNEKVVYLTFDDGPIPDVTEFVLEQLAKFEARATFFCVGDNVCKNPEIFYKVANAGHSIGNHTFNHLNGWKTENATYIENVRACEEEITKATQKMILETDFNPFSAHVWGGLSKKNNKKLFRPPYGLIKSKQAEILSKNFEIIMWDVLSKDYDKGLHQEKCLKNTIKNTQPGSIVLFHDSLKAEKNMKYALPKFLEHFKNEGFEFKSL
jgi:peptidoglycan-N-acetylglucosamine deacetylase